MKKKLAFLLLSLVVMGAFASLSPIVRFNPQSLFSTYPLVDTHNEGHISGYVEADWFENYQDVYSRYFSQDGLMDLGFEIEDEHVYAVMDLSIRQTLNSFYKTRYWSNIPFLGNTVNAVADMNFPFIAYGEYFTDNLLVSLGRRPVKWGPGTYDGSIGGSFPFLDNFWSEYTTDAGKGSFSYNFMVASFNSEALNKVVADSDKNIKNKKTLIAHKFSWADDSFRVSIGELNLVYGEYPNLMDISPFALYHNLYQDSKSNVMLSLSAEKVLELGWGTKVRLYGSFAMDDFDLPGEGENGKPAAIGYGGGIQLHVADGKGMVKTEDRNMLKEREFSFTDGLNISYEYYFASPYMYNRDTATGKFTVPLKMFGSRTIHEADAFFIGFKYGPNSSIHEIRAEYNSDGLYLGLTLGLLTRGDKYSIDSAYGKDAVTAGVVDYAYRYKLFGDKERTILLTLDGEYTLSEKLSVSLGLTSAFDLAHNKNAASGSLGVSYTLF